LSQKISFLIKLKVRKNQCGGSGMFILDPGSDFFPSQISDPNCLHPRSRILIKEFKAKKWFLSSKKYDPGCSSRIPDPDADFLPSRIPDPGVKKAPNPGSGSATLEKIYIVHLLTSSSSVSSCVVFLTFIDRSAISPTKMP
jgi:hypothetical protein